MSWVRNLGAVVAGFGVGSLANMSLITLSGQIWPVPEGLDLNDPAQFQVYLEGLPTGAFVLALLAHLAQAGLGGFVAAYLSRDRPVLLALVIGALTALASGAILATMGGPPWMWIELPLDLGLAYLAARAAVGLRGPSSA